MRLIIPTTLLASVLVAVLSINCTDSRRPNQSQEQSQSATPTPVTFDVIVLGAPELSGCTLDREGEFAQNYFSRSFNCAADERLTNVVGLEPTADAASKSVSNGWSTMDAAGEQIRGALSLRPYDPASLTIVNGTDSFGGKLGAEQEYVYCATFTDFSGTVKPVMYFGSFRHGQLVSNWTSYAIGGDCSGPSRSQQLGRQMAARQLQKFQTVLPRGATASTPVRATATPTRTP